MWQLEDKSNSEDEEQQSIMTLQAIPDSLGENPTIEKNELNRNKTLWLYELYLTVWKKTWL